MYTRIDKNIFFDEFFKVADNLLNGSFGFQSIFFISSDCYDTSFRIIFFGELNIDFIVIPKFSNDSTFATNDLRMVFWIDVNLDFETFQLFVGFFILQTYDTSLKIFFSFFNISWGTSYNYDTGLFF